MVQEVPENEVQNSGMEGVIWWIRRMRSDLRKADKTQKDLIDLMEITTLKMERYKKERDAFETEIAELKAELAKFNVEPSETILPFDDLSDT